MHQIHNARLIGCRVRFRCLSKEIGFRESGQSDPHVGLGIAQWEAMRCEGAQISTYLFAKLFRLMVPMCQPEVYGSPKLIQRGGDGMFFRRDKP